MLRKVDVRTRSNRPNESVKQISIRSFLDTWEQFPRMETRFDDIQEEEWDRWRCLLRPDIISCRGYYRRRARKSTWRRTKGTLNALVTSTPRRRGVFTLPFFSSPSEYRTRSIERKKKSWREENSKLEGEQGNFTAKYREYPNISRSTRNINFSLKERAFNPLHSKLISLEAAIQNTFDGISYS